MDLTTRLGCCNLEPCLSKWWFLGWWLPPWCIRLAEKLQSTKSDGTSATEVQVGTPRYFLWAFSPLVEGLRNESGGTLGVFDALWHLLKQDGWLSNQCSWASYVPSEGWTPSGPSTGERGSFTTELCSKEATGIIKNTISPCRICLFVPLKPL